VIPERLVPGTLEWEQFHCEHEQRYQFFADRYPGLDVLDAACGIGYGSDIVARSGAKSVTGIDIASDAVDYARNHYARSGVEFLQVSAEELTQIGRTFDLVLSFETIEHLEDPRLFLRDVRHVLRPGGWFICSTPNKFFGRNGHKHVNPYHVSEMSFDEFATVFQEEFDLHARYHQSHSESYRRHIELVGELQRYAKAARFSKLLALENRVRRWLGKEQWHLPAPAPNLTRAVPGDYVISPFERPLETHLVYILVGRPK
jgi:2-polyprenyl-3-methyl-5-hydroxy-6-metoxy-1,4-benzoquinol methylase